MLLIVLLISVKVSVAQEEVYEQLWHKLLIRLKQKKKYRKIPDPKNKKRMRSPSWKRKREIKSSETWRQFWIAISKLYVYKCVAYCWIYGGERQTGIRRRPILIYQRFRFSNINAISFFVYGADIYARGFLYKGLFLESRYDLVNKPSYYNLDRRLWVNHLLLGAGYAAPIGKIGVFNISLLYNVLDNDESIYQGTFSDKVPLIINMGFGFGIGGK